MANDGSTVVTRVSGNKDSSVQPLMSYTAVTSHREMAEAFVKEVMRFGQRIMPDHDLTVEDMIAIFHIALNKRDAGVVMLEGRHLRGRITEQLSRADRYSEPFSLMVIKLEESTTKAEYEAVVDTLCERMRKTDLMFLFKSRLVLILPHTKKENCDMLSDRIGQLLKDAVNTGIQVDISHLTYPDADRPGKSTVLDWAEDQLR
jgi:hypothetical protein